MTRRNPWIGARGHLWQDTGLWRMEVTDMRGRVVWRDHTGFHRSSQGRLMDNVAGVVGAVRRMEGIGQKLRTADRIGL